MPRRMPTTLRPRFRAQAHEGSLLHHAPNRRPRFPRSTPPPGPSAHPSGFSVRPGSAAMIPQTGPRRLSEIHQFGRRCKLGNIQRQLCTDQSCHLHLRRTPLCLLFLISDFGQNFANQSHFSRGRRNFSFQSDCVSASRSDLNCPFHVKLRWW